VPRGSNSAESNRSKNGFAKRESAIGFIVSAAECIQDPPLRYDWSDLIIPGPHIERWETRHESVSEDYFQRLDCLCAAVGFFPKMT